MTNKKTLTQKQRSKLKKIFLKCKEEYDLIDNSKKVKRHIIISDIYLKRFVVTLNKLEITKKDKHNRTYIDIAMYKILHLKLKTSVVQKELLESNFYE